MPSPTAAKRRALLHSNKPRAVPPASPPGDLLTVPVCLAVMSSSWKWEGVRLRGSVVGGVSRYAAAVHPRIGRVAAGTFVVFGRGGCAPAPGSASAAARDAACTERAVAMPALRPSKRLWFMTVNTLLLWPATKTPHPPLALSKPGGVSSKHLGE
jgi:hypothetical protein